MFYIVVTLPALGIKIDAVPGRINAGFIIADREGIFMDNVVNYVEFVILICLLVVEYISFKRIS